MDGDFNDFSGIVGDSSSFISDPTAGLDLSSGFDFNSLGTGLSIAGTIGKAAGAYMAGQEQAAADKYNADLVRQQGITEQYQIGEAEVSTLSTQRAMYAKAGVTQTGSALDTAIQTGTQYELTKQIARYNTESKANMLDYEAKVAKQKGEFGAGMQLLEGGASLAFMLA